jgi:hypothetical protein
LDENKLKSLLKIARGYAIFVGAFGFLFGQLFNGYFSIAATGAGIAGILAGTFGGLRTARNVTIERTIIFSCIAGFIGVAADAYNYYTKLDIPGNYYAWFLIGPFLGSLLFICYCSITLHEPRQ